MPKGDASSSPHHSPLPSTFWYHRPSSSTIITAILLLLLQLPLLVRPSICLDFSHKSNIINKKTFLAGLDKYPFRRLPCVQPAKRKDKMYSKIIVCSCPRRGCCSCTFLYHINIFLLFHAFPINLIFTNHHHQEYQCQFHHYLHNLNRPCRFCSF